MSRPHSWYLWMYSIEWLYWTCLRSISITRLQLRLQIIVYICWLLSKKAPVPDIVFLMCYYYYLLILKKSQALVLNLFTRTFVLQMTSTTYLFTNPRFKLVSEGGLFCLTIIFWLADWLTWQTWSLYQIKLYIRKRFSYKSATFEREIFIIF